MVSEDSWQYLPTAHTFGFFTHADIASHVSTNIATTPGVRSQDVLNIEAATGVVRVFDEDLSGDEYELFNHHFGGTHLFFQIAPRLINNNNAPVHMDILIYIPYAISRVVNFEPRVYFSVPGDENMRALPTGNTNVTINEMSPHPNGTRMSLTVNLDTGIFPSRSTRGRLVIHIGESIDRNIVFGDYNNSLFLDAFGRLLNDIELATQGRRQAGSLGTAAELHVYFIYS